MTTAIKRRRGTTEQHATFTGLEGELTVDTSKNTVVVHNGSTAGGFPLARESVVNGKVSLTGDETIAGTKTFSSNPALSAGTANGVLYLNGSKVATSGSALTFDGTNFATTGTATATKLIPTGNVTAGNGMYLPTTNTLAWSTNGSERMRLDSAGNLGLGVTPSAWVTTTTSRGMQLGRSGSIFYSTDAALFSLGNNYYQDGASSYKYLTNGYALRYSQSDFNGAHQWFTSPSGTAGNAITFTQAMTLDGNGNLAVGTTSPNGRLTISGPSSSASFGNRLSFNLYNTASSGNQSCQIALGSAGSSVGACFIATDLAADGTETNMLTIGALSSINFRIATTNRIRIDSSGNLGIGTTAPTNILSLGGNSARTFWMERHTTSNTAGNNLTIQSGGATSGATDKNGGTLLLSSGTATGSGSSVITFNTATAGGAGTTDRTVTEKMRIDGAGNVGIGTASPTALLDVNSDIVRVRTAKTPASATAAGNTGDICWDADYVYICVATNTWKRSAISTW